MKRGDPHWVFMLISPLMSEFIKFWGEDALLTILNLSLQESWLACIKSRAVSFTSNVSQPVISVHHIDDTIVNICINSIVLSTKSWFSSVPKVYMFCLFLRFFLQPMILPPIQSIFSIRSFFRSHCSIALDLFYKISAFTTLLSSPFCTAVTLHVYAFSSIAA